MDKESMLFRNYNIEAIPAESEKAAVAVRMIDLPDVLTSGIKKELTQDELEIFLPAFNADPASGWHEAHVTSAYDQTSLENKDLASSLLMLDLAGEEPKRGVFILVGSNDSLRTVTNAKVGYGLVWNRVADPMDQKPHFVAIDRSIDEETVYRECTDEEQKALLEEFSRASNAFDRAPLLEELELGVRAYNILKRQGIQTIAALTMRSNVELEAIPNIGKSALREIFEVLEARGLVLQHADDLQ